nr:MAG TPA: hypothetical protein [Caudoviricetes sp.]
MATAAAGNGKIASGQSATYMRCGYKIIRPSLAGA